jgi:hypothetical protein
MAGGNIFLVSSILFKGANLVFICCKTESLSRLNIFGDEIVFLDFDTEIEGFFSCNLDILKLMSRYR